jgi:RecB family exonuclease
VSGSKTVPAPLETDIAGGGEPTVFLKRAEVRDVLAWLRLLLDPQDAAAVVRALGRPPIGLRQVDLARVIQVVRRRKLDLVSGLTAATESPQVPPEARERIQRFVEIHRGASADIGLLAPDVFLSRLIERLRTPARSLLAPEDAAAQDESLERLRLLAAEMLRERPEASVKDLARYLATVAPEAPSESAVASEPFAGLLESALGTLREEVLDGVSRIGGRLAELRLDTDLDISHGIVRYLELIKLSALLQRPEDQSLLEALADVNSRLLAATTPLQREILQTSTLDDTLLAAEAAGAEAAPAIGFREERSLGPFLPRKGEGLALSAGDIDTYRSCPLRYKFARVLRIPTEQTVHQRFGIAVHQVLERFHADSANGLPELLGLLDVSWRRSGLGSEGYEGELLQKARDSLTRYQARLQRAESEPVWFERPFSFRLGPHHLRGRVDRVDRLPGDGNGHGGSAGDGYELIDYKTSRPKSEEQLAQDIQLSLYALAAKEDWGLECSSQAYYYVLDDLKVEVGRDARSPEWVRDVVLEAGEGIMGQDFEPTPSRSACGICDYRIVCPAAEL